MAKRRLTRKQELFCLEYVANKGNGTQAYIKVYGTGEDTAGVNATKLLGNARVKNRIAQLTEVEDEENLVTVRELVEELRRAGFGKEGLTLRWSDKLKAIELLGKYKGIFIDRTDLTSGGKAFEVTRGTDIPEA